VLPVRLRPAAGGVPPPADRGDAGAGLSIVPDWITCYR
jgi:hypothetical protein